MINALTELLNELKGKTIRCASIKYDVHFNNELVIELRLNHTPDELNDFYEKLQFDYDNGYGMQYLEGTVWLENNEWLERYEYDGSERWVRKSYPLIPAHIASPQEKKE